MSFGIDFGTTNSCAVSLHGEHPQRFGDERGHPLPSIVAINRNTGHADCGRDVWDQRFELERDGLHDVIRSIKPHLGKDTHWVTNTRRWSVEDVVARVLSALSDRVKRFGIAEGITSATLSVPVNTNAKEKRALATAARQAGIEVKGFVSESTGAIFRYLSLLQHMRHVAVFDWGGGTLDVSVLALRSGSIHELAISSLKRAGNAIDEEIARELHRRIQVERGQSNAFEAMSPHDRNTLILEAERIKTRLARQPSVPMAAMYHGGAVQIDVTRESLRAVVTPFVQEALRLLEETIYQAGCTLDDVDQIVMVGGSSQLWALRQALDDDDRFPKYTIADDPDWDVAHGAALLSGKPGAYELGESVYLQLSDASRVELLTAGAPVSHVPREVNLVLVEDAQQANLVFQRAVPGRPAQTCGTLTVPTMGFLQEDLRLTHEVRPELSVWLRAAGERRREERLMELADLRFVYRLGV